jgi:hypothetical protein
MEFIRFVFKISVEFEIYLKKIKPGRAHLSTVHLPFNQATQLPGPIHACHRADHQVVTVLTTGRALAPVTAGHRRPCAVVALSSRAWEQGRALHLVTYSYPLTTLHALTPPSPLLTGATTHRRSLSTSVPRVRTAVTTSSARARLQLEAPAIEITGHFFFLAVLIMDHRLPSLSGRA